MKRLVLVVTAIAFAISPAIARAESKPGDQPSPTPPKQSTTQKSAVAAKSHDSGSHPVTDSWLTAKTKLSLAMDKRVKAREITVETNSGIITLRGKVRSAFQRSAAQEIAYKIHGAKGVSNALQIVPDAQRKAVDVKDAELENAVRARIMKDDGLRTASIRVRADNAVVTLMGKVHDLHGMTRAADLARGIPGVKAVRNELTQES